MMKKLTKKNIISVINKLNSNFVLGKDFFFSPLWNRKGGRSLKSFKKEVYTYFTELQALLFTELNLKTDLTIIAPDEPKLANIDEILMYAESVIIELKFE